MIAMILMWACNISGTVVLSTDTGSSDTNGVFPGDDAESDADTDADADTDTDSDADTDAYPRSWEGERLVVFEGYCDDTVFEDGEEVTEDSAFDFLKDACGSCDQVYEIQANPDTICYDQVSVSSRIYRGLEYDDDEVSVIMIYEYEGDWYTADLGSGTLEGNTVEYSYDGVYSGYDYSVYGSVTVE